ncbi:MAG: DnaJ domain-containing protein [Chitinophagales bacterium]
MLPDYFAVLGIPKDASEMEIKRAYRQKANEYHPAINRSSNSLDNFILVNEAYEILIHKNTHAIYLEDYQTTKDPLQYEVYYYWVNAARTRAAQHAALSDKEFFSTKFYRNTYLYSYPTLIVFMIIGAIMLITPFVTMVMAKQGVGIFFILGVIFIAWPVGLYFFVQSAIGFQSMKKYMH